VVTVFVGVYEWMLRFGSILEGSLTSSILLMTFVYQVGCAFVLLLVYGEGKFARIRKCE
jgi:hypothetical protein